MKPEETRKTIGNIKFMQELPEQLREKAIDLFEQASEQRSVPKDAVFIHAQEQTQNKGFLLLKGSVSIQKPDAPEVTCTAPELLGEMMQLTPAKVRTATVSAAEDCVVMRFDWADLWAKAGVLLTPEEQAQLDEAIKSLAWDHLVG